MAAEARSFASSGVVAVGSSHWLPFAGGPAGASAARPVSVVSPAPTRTRVRVGNDAEMGRRRRTRTLRRNVVCGAFVLAVGLFHVWTGLEVGRLGYALGSAQSLTQKLDHELHELRIEYATETVPSRLEAAAAERLGMYPPAPGQVASVP